MLVIAPILGVILILLGIVLFIVDLHVISHGLLTAGGIVTLCSWGVCSSGSWVLCGVSEGAKLLRAKRG
jgi:membrane-bound ClpP family serine protease